jgi:hypothetical protein
LSGLPGHTPETIRDETKESARLKRCAANRLFGLKAEATGQLRRLPTTNHELT